MSIPPSWRLCSCGSKQDVELVRGEWLCFACRLVRIDERLQVLDDFAKRGFKAQAAIDALTRREK